MSALPLPDVLAEVSRSFHVSLWLLPAETRATVALAYLLARAADTVADTRVVPREARLELLGAMARSFEGQADAVEVATDVAKRVRASDATPGEQVLLRRLPEVVDAVRALPAHEGELTRQVLRTIVRGMVLDLERFPGEDATALAALQTGEELVDYCWHVAGCVGEFWSALHAARLPALVRRGPAWASAWSAQGRAFGEALQLTNVLRDVPRDLAHGRCYLPSRELEAVGLGPRDLLDPRAWGRLAPVYRRWVARAARDAEVGLEHALGATGRHLRLRLAELVPLLLALRTLGVVLEGNPLDPAARRKVPRRVVWTTLLASCASVRDDRALVGLFRRTLRSTGLAAVVASTPP